MSEAATEIAVLKAWRTLLSEGIRSRVNELEANAHRCSRMADSSISIQLSEELDAIARTFERDADMLLRECQAAAYQLKFPWTGLP